MRELRTLREKLSRKQRKNRGRKIRVRRRLFVLRQVQFQLSERRVRHRSSERVARQRKIQFRKRGGNAFRQARKILQEIVRELFQKRRRKNRKCRFFIFIKT